MNIKELSVGTIGILGLMFVINNIVEFNSELHSDVLIIVFGLVIFLILIDMLR